MYITLFELAGYAMLGWLLLIFLPTWRVTRWIADTAVFLVYLSVLYTVGIVPLVVQAGPGIMRDFGTAGGVLGLMQQPDVALIAWIRGSPAPVRFPTRCWARCSGWWRSRWSPPSACWRGAWHGGARAEPPRRSTCRSATGWRPAPRGSRPGCG